MFHIIAFIILVLCFEFIEYLTVFIRFYDSIIVILSAFYDSCPAIHSAYIIIILLVNMFYVILTHVTHSILLALINAE